MKVLGISGSLRRDSYNTKLLREAARHAPEGVELEILDRELLRAIPAFDEDQESDPPASVEEVRNRVASADAVLFVTPEYNHSIPGAFKNAFDSLGVEWQSKPIGFVSYGASDGHRAVEHWRSVVANFSMHDVRSQVSLSLFTEFGENGFQPSDRREAELNALLDELAPAAKAMKAMRG